MTGTERLQSSIAEAAPVAEAPPVAAPKVAAVKLEMLGGDEIIQLSIKPSPWFIFLVSANVLTLVGLCAAFAAIAMQGGYAPGSQLPFQLLALLAVIRLGLATLQWASRLYVLTNRRVLRFTGVLNVHVAECRLVDIGRLDIVLPWYGPALRLGTIRLQSGNGAARVVSWDDVSRPGEVREILERAIRKSQNRD